MISHRRRLPHMYPDAVDLFVTWSLHGVLPASFSARPAKLSDGEAFVWMDRQLDTLRNGPMYLRQPAISQRRTDWALRTTSLRGHGQPCAPVDPSHNRSEPHLKSLKGATARGANRLLGRTGQPFWQKESYDHWVRNEAEFLRIRAYIENNPVKAGLVRTPEEYLWYSAGVEKSLDAARKVRAPR